MATDNSKLKSYGTCIFSNDNVSREVQFIKQYNAANTTRASIVVKHEGVAGNTIRYVQCISGGIGNTAAFSFTGEHICVIRDYIYKTDKIIGMIVSCTNAVFNLANNITPNISDTNPIVEITTTEKCKRVFGVVGSHQSSENGDFMLDTGIMGSVHSNKYKNQERYKINSIGEGAIWLCNKNGNFGNGDLITGSSVPGYGTLQDDDIVRNYTVGKITCDCVFALNKQKRKRLLHSFDESGNNLLVYSEDGNLQYEDDLDLSGNPIYEYPYDTRFLLPDSTLLDTEEEYHSRKGNGEDVFIACFVGCVYYCG
tara:strand:- start:356 stop:1288 length:933 start_codon:yes stop_codon:yes gene_type:complete